MKSARISPKSLGARLLYAHLMTITSDELVRMFGLAAESGNAALFVGAGLSTDAGIPDWGGLLADLRAKADVPDSLKDLPLVAQYIVTVVPGGRATLEAEILETVSGADNKPTLGHRTIAKMPIREIWTTNYDRLLERAMPGARVIVREEDLLDRTREASKRIIKMHGSLSMSNNDWSSHPVITRSDYEQYQQEHPRLWAALTATYLTQSTLFLGFSFADPNIEILLRLSRSLPLGDHREHFTVLRRPTDIDQAKLHDHRVRDLESTGVAVCEVAEYDELIPILRALERRTRGRNLFVTGNFEEKDNDIRAMSRRIGSQLASTEVSIVSLAGAAGTELSYSMGNSLMSTDAYSPDRLRYFFRQKNAAAPVMHQRFGTAIYSALQKEELREAVISEARAALVIGGGDGTADEVSRCQAAGIPVVPLAISGGTAEATWLASDPAQANLPEDVETARDWKLLKDDVEDVALAAAQRLILRAMYLD